MPIGKKTREIQKSEESDAETMDVKYYMREQASCCCAPSYNLTIAVKLLIVLGWSRVGRAQAKLIKFSHRRARENVLSANFQKALDPLVGLCRLSLFNIFGIRYLVVGKEIIKISWTKA